MAMHDGHDTLEKRLREELSPPPDQVERIVLRSLAAPRTAASRHDPRLRRLAPASLLALLTAAAVFFSLQLARPRPEAVVSIVNIGGVVIATSEEEERPLILSGAGERQSSGIILIRRGGQE
jgi:hypothetical protein